MNAIPLVDLKAQIQPIRAEIDKAIALVIDQTAFVLSPPLEAFEKNFAAYIGTKHCVGVQSGTAALHIALLALGVGRGDEVVTAPSSFFASAEAIALTGATPVFADVRPDTLNLDAQKLEAAITRHTRAIVPVHLFGQPADMAAIGAVAARHGLPIVEDACQAHGATFDGRRAGALGRAGCFSFYPGKNLGAFGEGGAITTDDDAIAAKARLLRNHGSAVKYHHDVVGLNYRLDGLQAAVLDVKLRYLEGWNERRRALAARYREKLAGVGDLRFTTEAALGLGAWHLFVVMSERRERIFEVFKARGVACTIHYPVPIHLQPAFRDLGHAPGSFPVAEKAAGELLSLPLYPELTEAQQDQVVDALGEAFR